MRPTTSGSCRSTPRGQALNELDSLSRCDSSGSVVNDSIVRVARCASVWRVKYRKRHTSSVLIHFAQSINLFFQPRFSRPLQALYFSVSLQRVKYFMLYGLRFTYGLCLPHTDQSQTDQSTQPCTLRHVLNIVTQQLTTHTAPTDTHSLAQNTKQGGSSLLVSFSLFLTSGWNCITCTHVHFPSGRGSPRAAAAARWLTQVKPKRAERDVFGREMS